MNKTQVLNNARLIYKKNEVAEIETAMDFAFKAHSGQKRLSGEPYIRHPLSVANYLIEWGMDADSVIAGLLHDTVEDTDVTLDQIETAFGRDVAFLVDGLTKISKARAGMSDLSQYLPTTRDNLSKLLIAISQDIRVIIIKLADRLHNLRTLSYLPKETQTKVARESLEVFAPIADRLNMGRVRVEMEELSFKNLYPQEYKKTENLMKKRLGKSTRKLGAIRDEVDKALKRQGIEFNINGRVKSIYSLYKKLKKVDGNIDDIYDLMALRIVVENKEDCYRVLGILHSMYQPVIARIKDYIATPKPNGYQSLHTTVITPTKQIVEFQIRTQQMHDFSERGLAASFHYNERKLTKDYIKNKNQDSKVPVDMQWVSQLQEIAGRLTDNEEISSDQLQVDLFKDRIFVYSPKGDIYNLPEGALPLDFAYSIHSDIGRHAYSFRVNGKIHPFDKPLANGDIVEVVTKSLSQAKDTWLQLVTTTHAKAKLRAQLRRNGVITTIRNRKKRSQSKDRDKS